MSLTRIARAYHRQITCADMCHFIPGSQLLAQMCRLFCRIFISLKIRRLRIRFILEFKIDRFRHGMGDHPGRGSCPQSVSYGLVLELYLHPARRTRVPTGNSTHRTYQQVIIPIHNAST